jgi:molybdate transport system substrate-binding protein
MLRPRLASRIGAALMAAVLLQPLTAVAQDLTVFAAASLKNALDEVNGLWAKTGKPAARLSYAASSALARQIEAGAPADLFISADLDWMGYLDRKGLVRAGTRKDLLGNAIVLIAPRDSAASLAIGPGMSLTSALGDGRLAMANVDSVPAGGAWEGVKNRVAQAENVRAALLLVSRGEAPLGLVYATDAAADPGVKIVGKLPADSHPPIVYPAAIVASSKSPEAAAYLAFLRSSAAIAAFERQGFTILE